ncbi:MAG TPA: hypothetical protein VL485_09325 [Ktedonobacteraceae bacterium]|jgi:hypothetical protein|nr:hypothetical protein [Ktedonobacteraceae bacterium]
MHDQSPLHGLSDPQDHSLGSQDAPTESSYDDASTVPYVPYRTQPLPTTPEQDGTLPTTPAQGDDGTLPAMASPPLSDFQFSTEKLPDSSQKRRLWFKLGLGLGLALVLLVFAAMAIYGYVDRPTPQKTLDAFCSALQSENYHEAYRQFTPALQGQFTEQDFALVLSHDKVVTCSHGPVSDASSMTSTNLKLVHKSRGVNNDMVFLTKDSQGAWKINDLQRVS